MEWTKKKVATEWDGCWFCSRCYSMHHWTEEANVSDNQKYCDKCRKELEKKEGKTNENCR